MTEPYVVLHGGFHKTATSHIQAVLNRNQKLLLRHGVEYVNHRQTRKQLTVPCQVKAYEKLGMDYNPRYTDAELDAITGAYFDDILAPGSSRIVISDENLAGHCGHCVKRGMLYRWRKVFVSTFAGQFPLPVQELHLSVRNYADFFAAAYVEFLRSVRSTNFIDIPDMKVRVLARMPGWHQAIESIAAQFPGVQIVVWKYEDFRQLEPVVLSNLCGQAFDISKLKPPGNKNRRPTASGRAVSEMLEQIYRFGADDGVSQRVEIQKKYPKEAGYPAFDPWTAEERTRLTDTYEADVGKIRTMPDVTFLSA